MRPTASASPWETPAPTWLEAIERYIAFIQGPTWRANAFHQDSQRETAEYVSSNAAATLEKKTLATLNGLARRRGLPIAQCQGTVADLHDLIERQGRHVARPERCSSDMSRHFRRAYFFNAASYKCFYCRRSAWAVYAENTGSEPRRTLRFELDHRISKRRLPVPNVFDPGNLVVACRSCNVIKGEMLETRFLMELDSLAAARDERAAK